MWNCVVLLVTVYIIYVDALPLSGRIENSTIYLDQNVENISTTDTNHDAENLTTITTNQISANITDHATKDDVSSTAKDEHVNNETNHQQESRYFNDEETYTISNLFGLDETNDNSETNNKSKVCHDSNNSEGCSDTNDSEDSENSEDSDESEASKGNEESKDSKESEDSETSEDSEKSEDSEGGEKKEDSENSDYTDYSDYDDYYGGVSDETVDPYASDEADKRNEIDNELYEVNYKGNVGSNGPNTKKYTGNDAKTYFDDYVRSESEAYHLYGDNVDEEGDKGEDISSVNDVFGEFPSIDREKNMKLNMENSGHIPSIAFASYYINLIYLILILHFHMEYLT